MIRLTTVGNNQVLDLVYAQLFTLDGKNRILIEDAVHFRVQANGGKLSPLTIEGYIPLTDMEKYKELEKYLTDSRDILSPAIPRMPQFEITQKRTTASESRTQEAVINDTELVFRGLLNSWTFELNTEQNMLLNYSIVFLVYPYANSAENQQMKTKQIRQVYHLG